MSIEFDVARHHESAEGKSLCHSDPVVAGEESRFGSGGASWEERVRARFLPFPLASLGVRVGMTPVFRERLATCTEALDALH
jgi:hypothetical protein